MVNSTQNNATFFEIERMLPIREDAAFPLYRNAAEGNESTRPANANRSAVARERESNFGKEMESVSYSLDYLPSYKHDNATVTDRPLLVI
jgi:hypothetical protein